MIDFLEGAVEEVSENYLLINVGGTGYGMRISTATFDFFKDKTGDARIFTYLAVRETAVELYGFSRREEKEIFLVLLGVNGIGARAAINILSNITVERLKSAIASGKPDLLTKIPGLGRKKSERIIVELKDKFKNMDAGDESAEGIISGGDYIEALEKLGFSYSQARDALKEVIKESGGNMEEKEIIKKALKHLAPQ
ncbi:MAG: Holliday junction branch migration protein RuvA [Candidatus Goldiibacteriota bacterium]